MASPVEWANGYARQADADFATFQTLQALSAPECHKLQFLQMACEKLVKAYLCGRGTSPASLQTSPAYVRNTLPIVLREHARLLNYTGRKARAALDHARRLAEEVDVLAPAVDRGGLRPDNCEYPWEDGGGALHIPLDWSFHPSRLIEPPAGPAVIKLIRGAIDRLSG